MFTGVLPIGTVVLLKESSKKLMIMGICQKQMNEGSEELIWDYAGCLYPEGYLDANKVYLFNNEQVEKIFAIGYQDEEQFEFKAKVDIILEELRKEKTDTASEE